VRSVRDVAAEFGVSAKVIRGEIERGALTAHKIGGKGVYRIPQEAVDEYRAQTLVVPASMPVRTPRRPPRQRSGEIRHLRTLHEETRSA